MFDADMTVEVNPTLGKGSDTVRMMTLQQIKQDQMMVFQQFGPTNPVVGIPEMLNTITDMLEIANIKNVSRYFKMPPPAGAAADAERAEGARRDDHRRQGQLRARQAARPRRPWATQQFNVQKAAQDEAFRREKLAQETAYKAEKIRVQEAGLALDHEVDMAQVVVDMAKADHAANARGGGGGLPERIIQKYLSKQPAELSP